MVRIENYINYPVILNIGLLYVRINNYNVLQHRTNRNARDWSKIKFRELFKDQQFDTNAGLYYFKYVNHK